MKCLAFLLFCVILKFSACISAENALAENKKLLQYTTDFLKSASILTKSTEVAALGRVADLGDLYDARTDNFVEISLFTTDLSGDAIHSTDNAFSAIDYIRTESLSEKMDKLGVTASLSVSVMGGLVKGSGSGKYLSEDKKSAKSAKTSLIYSIRTVREDLKIFSKTSRSLIDTFLLENIDATHVVVGVEWGADVVLSLEETNTDSSSVLEVQAKLEATLGLAVLSVSGSAEVDVGSSDVESSTTFSLHINGDIIPNTVPQTINESISFIRDIPNLIEKENGGKGKIMKYILMPLSTVQKVLQAESNKTGIVKDIDLELIHQFMEIFQEMKDSELEINDIYSSLNRWKLMVPESYFNEVSEIKSNFDSFTNSLRVQFASSVVQFRNGNLDQEELRDLIASYRNSNWTSADINEYLDHFTLSMQKARLLDLFQSYGALFVDRRTDKYKILTDNYEREVKIISINLNSVNVSSVYVHVIVKLLKVELGKESEATPYYIEDVEIGSPEVKVYLEGVVVNSFPVGKTEYVFLKDLDGKVIIFDAKSYKEVTIYNLAAISSAMIAIASGKFYNIDTVNGIIMSTGVENIVNGPDAVNWTHVGSFPSEQYPVYNGVAVNNSIIYFVTDSGVLYLYDTTLKTVTKIGTVTSSNYASLVVVDGVLYIHKHMHFYSFDGVAIKEIATPETRYWSGLFQLGSLVCRVGGNATDIGFNPDPVSCYNPHDETWTVTSYLNQYRRYPGITSTESGTYIFGGYLVGSNSWLNSVEVFNPKTKIWSHVPSPLINEPHFVQAVTFYF